ncbi:methyl-accepting chemotaxis protein [Pseudomonas sp. MWU12-3103b]|uniref:methyl-accepting chemotaxis protein n=1 Tax=Pseudomonas sp. MWU12-3103b TaxID=2928857 RepID=UPI001FFF0F62|nr:methyl-accepting chemotaxis protein [Pseudomonas sp. MWU12-3103b]
MKIKISIARKILGTAALIIAAAFTLFSFYNDSQQRASIKKDLDNYIQEMGASTASGIQDWLSGKILRIEALAEDLAESPEQSSISEKLKRGTLQSNFLFTYVGERNGNFVQEPWEEMPSGYDPRNRPWYVSATQAGQTILTEPYLDSNIGKLVITIATPLLQKNGQQWGVVGGDLQLDTIVKKINTLNFDNKGFAFLTDENGKILVHPDNNLVGKTLSDIFSDNSLTTKSKASEVQQNGKQQIISFTPISGIPSVKWYIGISIDKEKAYAALQSFRETALIVTLIAIITVIIGLGLLISTLMRPVRAMSIAMQEIAEGEGNLTQRLEAQGNDEFGELARSFNRFVDRIHVSIRKVSSATDHLNIVARQVTYASNASISNSDDQAYRTNSVATAITELGAAALEISRNAAFTSENLSNARNLAGVSKDVVGQTINAIDNLSIRIGAAHDEIHNLNHQSINIGQILDVITGISQQTNLLALNAAIEAARAGEAGRGFAVVADEVRNLAYRTQESAQQVQTLIEELQRGATQAAQLMRDSQAESGQTVTIANKAGVQLTNVAVKMDEIDGMSHSVAAATEEQSAVVDSIHLDITQINSLNQQGVKNSQLTLAACMELEKQASILTQLVAGFRI